MPTREQIISERIRTLAVKVLDKPQLTPGDFQKLGQYLNAAFAKDPNNIENYLLTAKIYRIQINNCRTSKERTNKIVGAVEALQSALRLGKNIEISRILSALYAELGKYDLAEQYAGEVLAEKRDVKSLEITGDCLVARKAFANALGHYVEALKQEPANNELLAKKAFCLLHEGNYQEAMAAVDEALKYTPDYGLAKSVKNQIKHAAKKHGQDVMRPKS